MSGIVEDLNGGILILSKARHVWAFVVRLICIVVSSPHAFVASKLKRYDRDLPYTCTPKYFCFRIFVNNPKMKHEIKINFKKLKFMAFYSKLVNFSQTGACTVQWGEFDM